ncbi:hypothetical protein AB0G00_23845 [Nocardia salmonicida]|uniref:hypothetical protein n=1 Tax=Nocardia salmonicida TaxID=53431 RepID=UPI0033D1AD2F
MSITDQTFVAAVRKRAAEAPDFVYPQPLVWSSHEQDYVESDDCLYVEPDPETNELRGSCLLGCGLVDVGVDPVELVFDNEATGFATALRRLRLNLSPPVVDWADAVQAAQDMGCTWREAITNADLDFPLPKGLSE